METLLQLLQVPDTPPCSGIAVQRQGDLFVVAFAEGNSSKAAPSTAFTWLVRLWRSLRTFNWVAVGNPDPITLGFGLAGTPLAATELARAASDQGELVATADLWAVVTSLARSGVDPTVTEKSISGTMREVMSCVLQGDSPIVKPDPKPRSVRRKSSVAKHAEQKSSEGKLWEDPCGTLEALEAWAKSLKAEVQAEDKINRLQRPDILPQDGGAIAVIDIVGSHHAWPAAAAAAADVENPSEVCDNLLEAVKMAGRALRGSAKLELGWELWSGGDSWVFAFPDAGCAGRWAAGAVDKL
eukprot:Hpha_TRINITY_DN32453_c0_g1::TRINITY_DN32453_c0_g1_i1::g.30896::m.30896